MSAVSLVNESLKNIKIRDSTPQMSLVKSFMSS